MRAVARLFVGRLIVFLAAGESGCGSSSSGTPEGSGGSDSSPGSGGDTSIGSGGNVRSGCGPSSSST